MCHDTCAEVRGQLPGVGSLLPSCGSRQSGQPVQPFPDEPSHWPCYLFGDTVSIALVVL